MPNCTTKCESCGDIVYQGFQPERWYEVGSTLWNIFVGPKNCDKCGAPTLRIIEIEKTEKDGPPIKESKCASVLMSKEKQREACAKLQGDFSKKLMKNHYGIK